MTDDPKALLAEARMRAANCDKYGRAGDAEAFTRLADALERATADSAPPEIRRNDDGTLDEIVAQNASVHLEQMETDMWWIGVGSGGKYVNVWLRRDKRSVVGNVEECG